MNLRTDGVPWPVWALVMIVVAVIGAYGPRIECGKGPSCNDSGGGQGGTEPHGGNGDKLQPCKSFEACLEDGERLRDAHNLEGALERFGRALDLASPRANPGVAFLWCKRGDLLAELGRPNQALGEYTRCIDWTEDDPDQHQLRSHAERRMREPEHH